MSIIKYKDIQFVDGKFEIEYKNGMKIIITHGSVREPRFNNFPNLQYVNSSGHVFDKMGDIFPPGFSEDFIDLILIDAHESWNIDLDSELETPPSSEEVALNMKTKEIFTIIRLSKNNKLNYVFENESAIATTRRIMINIYDRAFYGDYPDFEEYKKQLDKSINIVLGSE